MCKSRKSNVLKKFLFSWLVDLRFTVPPTAKVIWRLEFLLSVHVFNMYMNVPVNSFSHVTIMIFSFSIPLTNIPVISMIKIIF